MPTSIFDVPVRVAEDMADAAFPPHEVTNAKPGVNPADWPEALEAVVVLSRANDDAAVLEWMSFGSGGREERYIVDVHVRTQVPGRSWAQMMARLADLVGVVLDVYTDSATSRFLPPGGLEAGGANRYGIFHGMANAELQDQWPTDEGWAGECRVALRIAARI